MRNESSAHRSAGIGHAFLALSCVGFIASAPAMAASRETPAPVATDDPADPQEIVVEGERVQERESPKATRALIDTPQTVTVIGDQTIRKQTLLTLRDALSTQNHL